MTLDLGEMPQKQIVVRDDVTRRTVFEVMQDVFTVIGAPYLAFDFLVLMTRFQSLPNFVEVVHVYLRTLVEIFFAFQEGINSFNSD